MKMKKQAKSIKVGRPHKLLHDLSRKAPDKLFGAAFRQQYGALCFRYGDAGQIDLLVVTSRDSGRWIIPKGWPMKGKKPHEAAVIEAWEEAGVRGKAKKKAIGRYTYLKELDGGVVVPCVVEIFQVEVDEVSSKFKERGQRILAWVSPDEAARRVREIELEVFACQFPAAMNRDLLENARALGWDRSVIQVMCLPI
ncbi:8-oxo-dGTP pyrophosphatase MutT, NUDIX family [Rhizobium sp. NFR07]|uniref:NUDIX hydrolase n=1 Tax=Rhizobium sp. NFR07 TaxID=1566262 RepID=UPI0008F2D395|nr:NUDIX hydrolase [Rhizobium sp. NFR07]SFB55737.1 8-oxo-dGTP pyrophosphatase MutT, NUDIX family [Rhizobium sp. NFR07]